MNTLSRLPRKLWIILGAVLGVFALIIIIGALTPPQHQEPFLDNRGATTQVAYHSDGTQWFLVGMMMGMHSNYYGYWHHDYYSPVFVQNHYHYYYTPSGVRTSVASAPPTQLTPMHPAPRMGTQGTGTTAPCGHGALPPSSDMALMAYHDSSSAFLNVSDPFGNLTAAAAPPPARSSGTSTTTTTKSAPAPAPAQTKTNPTTSAPTKTVTAPAPGSSTPTKPTSTNCK